MASIPAGPPWTWAALRVMPSIRGTRVAVVDSEDLEELGFRPVGHFPSVHLPPGVDVICSIEAEVMGIHVDQGRLDSWDKPIEDVMLAALSNLRRTVGMWSGGIFEDRSIDGTLIRQLSHWPHWAVTLLLVPDELKRIFGDHDQLFIAPYHCVLLSLPVDASRDLAADIVDMFGVLNPGSLLLGLPAFVLHDGILTTEELPGLPELPKEEEWHPETHRLADLIGW